MRLVLTPVGDHAATVVPWPLVVAIATCHVLCQPMDRKMKNARPSLAKLRSAMLIVSVFVEPVAAFFRVIVTDSKSEP